MSQFPTPAHLVSWAKLSPQTIQSGPKTKVGKTGQGNRCLKGVLGEVATAAAKTPTFLGEQPPEHLLQVQEGVGEAATPMNSHVA